MSTLSAFIPMFAGVVGAAACLLLSAWGRVRTGIAIAASGLAVGAVMAGVSAGGATGAAAVGSRGVFALPVSVCLVLGAVVLAAALGSLAERPDGGALAALAALAASAAALAAAATDVGMLFLGIEALALAGYGLVALGGTDRAREAAMKWFIQGSVATAVFIIGIGVLLVRAAGSLSYGSLSALADSPATAGPIAVGFTLVLIALAFKAGAFPFHSWMPDAFETAPAPATAVLASAGKVAPIAAMVWLVVAAPGSVQQLVTPVVAMLALASIVFGNLAGLRQRSLSRMLAYSGVAQVGYALAGVAIVSASVNVLVFVALYALTSASSFVFITALKEREPGWDGSVAGLAGLSRRRPALAVSLAVIMFSLTGIPLTAGFWGKFLVFGAASVNGYLWLAIVAVIGSVVSFGYYGRVLRTAFMEPAAEAGGEPAARVTIPLSTVVTVALAISIVVIGILPFIGSGATLSSLIP